MNFSSKVYPFDVRIEVAQFANTLCNNPKTCKLFVCCRGLTLLSEFLDELISVELIRLTIDTIKIIFELQVSRNDFCYIFAKHSLLPKLASTLNFVNSSSTLRSQHRDLDLKILHLIYIFSSVDSSIKERISHPSCSYGMIKN